MTEPDEDLTPEGEPEYREAGPHSESMERVESEDETAERDPESEDES